MATCVETDGKGPVHRVPSARALPHSSIDTGRGRSSLSNLRYYDPIGKRYHWIGACM